MIRGFYFRKYNYFYKDSQNFQITQTNLFA